VKNTKQDIIQPLNPADYFTLAMDQEIRQEQMPGSLCGFAMELGQTPDIDVLSARIAEFVQRFPLVLSSLQQQGRRYYWCKRAQPHPVFFQHHCPVDKHETDFQKNLLSDLINHQEARETIAPLQFHLLISSKKNIFFMRWIHPFCDARGAELILQYLCTDDPQQRQLFDIPETLPLVDIQLKKFKWWKKIALFFKAKNHIEQLDRYQSILPVQTDQAPERLNFSTRKLSKEQTRRIAKNARKQAGLTGTSLYYIGCLMRALNKINPQHEGEAYCVPYAFNLRKQKALSPVFGNHVCALFAQAPKALLHNREKLFKHLKEQNANTIRQQLDYAFLPVMWAASWLSLEKYGTQLRKSYNRKSERSSFWFSDIGQPDLNEQNFFNAEITGLFHLCQVTSPPGLALLSCQHRQQLILTYNYTEPLLDEQWLDKLHDAMVLELLAP
jgi:hypothetical protein